MTSMNYEPVLQFWFGDYVTDKEIIANQGSLWWKKDNALDDGIHRQFGEIHTAIVSGALDSWKAEAKGMLAMIIVLDQFSRNMFRDSGQAFAQDSMALSLTREGMESGMDKALIWSQRVFFYMPLMHAESLKIQELSVKTFRELTEDVPGDEQDLAYGHVDYAIKHWEVIKRFGRFPHRNEVLDRQSTEEEIVFLQKPGSSF